MTIEPLLALRTAVRAALVGDAGVALLVPADRVRAGWVRADDQSAITLRDGQTLFMGRAAGGQVVARCFLYLDLWSTDADAAQSLGGAVAACMFDAPNVPDLEIDEWARPSFSWMRDPDPARSMTHGAATLDCVARWRP